MPYNFDYLKTPKLHHLWAFCNEAEQTSLDTKKGRQQAELNAACLESCMK